MKPSEDLFELIKSLSKSEKGYFKKYSKLYVQGEDNNYILLFDAIDKQKKYDEKKLILKFRHHDFTRNISVAKNYLYSQIMYSMEAYHHSIHTEVRSLMHRTEFLFEKGLYKQALKSLKKAKEHAKENEMYWALLEIYRLWEINLALKNLDFNWIKRIMKEEADALALAHNTKIYHDLFFTMADRNFSLGMTRDNKQLKEIKKIIQNPYLADETKAKTFYAKLRLYETQAFYAEAVSDSKRKFLYGKKMTEHFAGHPEKIKQNILAYVSCLHNLLISCIEVKQFGLAERCLHKMEGLLELTKKATQKTRILFTLHNDRLHLLNDRGYFSEAAEYMEPVYQFVTEYGDAINDYEKTLLFGNTAIAYFGQNKYKECISWLNKIRNEVSFDVRTDIESFLRVFYIIAHYEAGNSDLLPYLIQSTYRFLKQKKRLYKFETIVMDFLRKQQSADTKEKLINEFKKLRTQMSSLKNDTYEKVALEFFDYLSWLDSKIENKSFAKAVRQE